MTWKMPLKLTDLAMNESFPSDEPNDSDGEREGETKTNNFEDVPPGALCDFDFVIIKLKVEGKDRHKFFVAITVSKDPLTEFHEETVEVYVHFPRKRRCS